MYIEVYIGLHRPMHTMYIGLHRPMHTMYIGLHRVMHTMCIDYSGQCNQLGNVQWFTSGDAIDVHRLHQPM